MQHGADGLTAAIFDLDGTLIDTAPGLRAVLNRMLEQAGLPALDLDTVKHSIGGTMEDMVMAAVRSAGGNIDAGWTARYLVERAKHDVRDDRPFDGVSETLAGLHEEGIKLAVCTNKRHMAAEEVLEGHGLLGLFDVVLGEDRMGEQRKPHPRHLLAVLEELGVRPGQAVMVGDHANDFNCARAAGVPVVLCSYGYSPTPIAEMGPDAIIDEFSELPAAFARLSQT